MKGRFVLLLSLLCVAQALPLSLNDDDKYKDLKRIKRHQDRSNIADREVRTIISAIVDAILDGDKQKRSEIPEDNVKSNMNGQQNRIDAKSDIKRVGGKDLNNIKKLKSNMEEDMVESGLSGSGEAESDESGSGFGITNDDLETNKILQRQSLIISKKPFTQSSWYSDEFGSADNVEKTKRNFIEIENDPQSGSGEENKGSSGSDDGSSVETVTPEIQPQQNENTSSNEKNYIPYTETGRIKRDEEGQQKTYQHFTDQLVQKVNTETKSLNNINYLESKPSKENKIDRRDKERNASAKTNIIKITAPVKDSRQNDIYYNIKNNVESADIEFDTDTESGSGSNRNGEQASSAPMFSGSGSGIKTESEQSNNFIKYVPQIDSKSTIMANVLTNVPQKEISTHPLDSNGDYMYSDRIEKRNNIANEEEEDGTDKKVFSTLKSNINTKRNLENNRKNSNQEKYESNIEFKQETKSTNGDNEDERSHHGDSSSSPMTQPQSDNTTEISSGDEGNYSGESSGTEPDSIRPLKPQNEIKLGESKKTSNNSRVESIITTPQETSTTREKEQELDTEYKQDSEKSENNDDGSDEKNQLEEDEGSTSGMGLDFVESSGNDLKSETIENFGKLRKEKSTILNQIVHDMARAAVESVTNKNEEDEDEEGSPGAAVVKKSVILIDDMNENIPTEEQQQYRESEQDFVMTAADDGSVLKEERHMNQQNEQQNERRDQITTKPIFQSQLKVPHQKNSTLFASDNQKEMDKALKALLQSILTEDPDVREKIKRMEAQRKEEEEKLESDILDLMKNTQQTEEERRQKVNTGVKDFEGFIDALSNENSLSSWKHDIIVRKLERDLLSQLNVPEEEEMTLIPQADRLVETAEMESVKQNIGKVEASTSEFAQRHSDNLKSVKQFAITSLTPIIESLPMERSDINELVHKISESAWLRMITNSNRKTHVRKIKDGFKRLFMFGD